MALAEIVPELASPLADPEAGGTLAVDLAAIEANWRALTQKLMTVECAAVVKANAYGLGIDAVTAKLAAAGCKTFFVADVAEARRVRARAREATIYVLDGFAPDAAAAFVEINARPVINSIAELAEWDAFIAASKWQGGAAFHVDTGMNRLGMTEVEVAALAPRLEHENHGVMLLMSHLACAEVPDHPLNAAQIQRFRDLHRLYPGVPASLANSSGIFLGEAAHFDLARPGAALYGINPTPGQQNPMQGVVELTGPNSANPQHRAGRNRRLRRDLDGEAGVAPRRGPAWLRRWGVARRQCRRPPGRRRRHHCRQAVPVRRAHFHGFALRRYHGSSRWRGPPARPRNRHRPRSPDRRIRGIGRHDRL